MNINEIGAKDIIAIVGFMLLCFFAYDYFADIQNNDSKLEGNNMSTLVAVKDVAISIVKIESDVSHIRENSKASFESLSQKINNLSSELKTTRESLNNSLQETNNRVYILQQDFGKLDGRIKLVEFKQETK